MENGRLGEIKVDHLIVADQNGIQIQCLCHGYKKENLVCRSIYLKQGQLLTIKNRKKYIVDTGWFVLVQINHDHEEFMFAEKLEEAIHSGKIMNEVDCLLRLFSVSYELDRSLASRDKEQFLKLSAAKNELTFLYEQLCGKVPVGS